MPDAFSVAQPTRRVEERERIRANKISL